MGSEMCIRDRGSALRGAGTGHESGGAAARPALAEADSASSTAAGQTKTALCSNQFRRAVMEAGAREVSFFVNILNL